MSNSPPDPLPPDTQRAVRRTFLTLLAIGALIGGVTAFGIVVVMDRLNLIGVPEQQQP